MSTSTAQPCSCRGPVPACIPESRSTGLLGQSPQCSNPPSSLLVANGQYSGLCSDLSQAPTVLGIPDLWDFSLTSLLVGSLGLGPALLPGRGNLAETRPQWRPRPTPTLVVAVVCHRGCMGEVGFMQLKCTSQTLYRKVL